MWTVDPQDEPSELGVGTSAIPTLTLENTSCNFHSPYVTDSLVTQTSTSFMDDVGIAPLNQSTQNYAQVDEGEECDIASFEACFPGSSHVTRTRPIFVTFLVNNELIPLTIDKIPSI